MDNQLLQVVHYFRPFEKYFWRWAENGQVIEWHNGETICYREELMSVLQQLVPTGLPPLGSILLLLAVFKQNGPMSPEKIGMLQTISQIIREKERNNAAYDNLQSMQLLSYQYLGMVNELPEKLKTGNNRAGTIFTIFKDRTDKIPPPIAQRILNEFNSGRLDAHIFKQGWKSAGEAFLNDFGQLNIALSGFPTAIALETAIKTGLYNLPAPPEELITIPPSEDDDLLEVLRNDPQTEHIALLTSHLIAALNIPMHTSGSSDQAFGGVSDISNRGNFDRLLLSELAHDDLSLLARLANNEALYLRREELPWTDKTDSAIALNNTDLVFAGYGVVAPEYNWNDYAGLDVKGKVVLVLVNDPGYNSGDSTLFKGKTMTYYGRWTYKFEEAARQGAKGCLIIHNTQGASYPFAVVQNNWNGSRLRLDNRGKTEQLCDVIGWVSGPSASKLLTAAGVDSSVLAKADTRGFKGMPLNVKLSTTMQVKTVYNKSHNVIGKITGSSKPDEYIIYTAHWDHLGIGKADETGDTIYNGAFDNASATAGLLELARGFKSMKDKPARTIIFLAVTAEEQGLWGSAWYAQNPVYPAAKTVANINMDGLNPFEKTKDIIVVGRGQSELEDYLQQEAEKEGRYIAFENHPEAGYYYRSDHFNFAKVGIPSLYTEKGTDVVGKGKEYGEKMHNEYEEKHYHRPSDEYDAATWKFEGGLSDLKLLFNVGKRLAFEEKVPGWKEGSEFKALRK